MPLVAAALANVSFEYGNRSALSGVSFEVRKGELLAILGPNGCGKSTALKVLAGLIRPSAGEVVVEGCLLQDFRRCDLARRLALLSQAGVTPPGMTVLDLVGMGRFAHESWLRRQTVDDREAVARAMTKMDVSDLAERRLGELSGGQLQRVRMAMALAQDAGVLLLDEPTNHLDLKHQHGLLAIAREEARAGRAVVAVLHELAQVSLYADRVVLMHEGRVMATGAPKSVLNPEAVEAVYGLRTTIIEHDGAVIHLPVRARP